MLKLIYLLLFFAISCCSFKTSAQSIARQALSSQGATQVFENGRVITQTVGQTGMIGSFYSGNGIQGFQQPLYSKFAVLPPVLSTKLVVYPNPFVDVVKVNVPDVPNQNQFSIQVFDVNGRLIETQNQALNNNTLSINLGNLPNGSYILLVNSASIKFSSVVLKQ
jgi:hypothetical protein